VGIQKSQLGQLNTKPAGGIPVYIPCTGSLPTNGVVSVVVGVGTCSSVQILNSLIVLFTLKYIQFTDVQ